MKRPVRLLVAGVGAFVVALSFFTTLAQDVSLTEIKLTASDGAPGDQFSFSVATSGNVIVIGVRNDDVPDNPDCNVPPGPLPPECNQGSAYVFERLDGIWMETAKLTASDAAGGDFFGAVATSGNTIVVGARNDDVPDNAACKVSPRPFLPACNRGSAYVFERLGGTWVETAKLTVSDAAVFDEFGGAVATRGNVIVVGARNHHDPDAPDCNVSPRPLLPECNKGSAYVFERLGETWVETAKLTASDAALFDEFGGAVATSGNVIVVGARSDDIPDNPDCNVSSRPLPPECNKGSAYVFERLGGTWVEAAKLTGSDAAVFDEFGGSVATSGNLIVIGAPNDDDPDTPDCSVSSRPLLPECNKGATYVFERLGETWVETAKLTASDVALGDQFSFSVATSGDVIVVGARDDDDPNSPNCNVSPRPLLSECNQGAAYVFERLGGIWVETAKLAASDAAGDDFFGAVATSGNTIVVGALLDDDRGINSGSAYVYE